MATVTIPAQQSASQIPIQLTKLMTELATAKCHLTQGAIPPNAQMSQAELLAIEASVGSYAAALAGPFKGPYAAQSGAFYLLSLVCSFHAALLTSSESINGGWLDDGATNPLLVWTFAPPLVLGGASDPTINLVVEVTGVLAGIVEVVM